MDIQFVYSPKYDLMSAGLGSLHPFDMRKFSRAWAVLTSGSGALDVLTTNPETLADDGYMARVHTAEYLDSLKKSRVLARILEVGLARFVPNRWLQSAIVDPMRLATEGTRLAAELALEGAVAMNFGGGFHHAFADHGEGFCVFADAALAIDALRRNGKLSPRDTVAMIDLDAHRGNGFQAIFSRDPAVKIFDMYNAQVYPGMFKGSEDEYPFMIPLKSRLSGEVYLKILRDELPKFLDSCPNLKLVFYNAGTDILASDPLGGMNVSYDAVVERDRYVIETLTGLGVPTAVVTSGGYTDQSHQLIAQLGRTVIDVTGRG